MLRIHHFYLIWLAKWSKPFSLKAPMKIQFWRWTLRLFQLSELDKLIYYFYLLFVTLRYPPVYHVCWWEVWIWVRWEVMNKYSLIVWAYILTLVLTLQVPSSLCSSDWRGGYLHHQDVLYFSSEFPNLAGGSRFKSQPRISSATTNGPGSNSNQVRLLTLESSGWLPVWIPTKDTTRYHKWLRVRIPTKWDF